VDEFKTRIDEWIDVFRNTKPAKGQKAVLIPGDPEHAEEEIRRREGIPLLPAVVEDLQDISKQTGIRF
jgi:L-2-hydroxycarboxylate dehydrogenase (NAD+)